MLLLNLKKTNDLIKKQGLHNIMQQLISRLQIDYARWDDFTKVARHATDVANGVIELMPASDSSYYACKYVNGHPHNPDHGLLTVVALGLLSDVKTGYPLMLSEMTLSTAIRTAAMAACVAQYCADASAKKIAIIGCGAQSEFQIAAHSAVFNFEKIFYYDIDTSAMEKFADNIKHNQDIRANLIPCDSIKDCVKSADIVITATTLTQGDSILKSADLQPHAHISAIGGDCPGKNELQSSVLQNAEKIIVEFPPQTFHEGESEQLTEAQREDKIIPFYKLAKQGDSKQGGFEKLKQGISVFDSVGFAIEDYSILVYWYELCKKYKLADEIEMLPELKDPKNLWGALHD